MSKSALVRAVSCPMGGLEFSRQEAQAAARDKRLLSFELETSRACNFRCIYCYARAGQPMPGEMSLEEMADAAGQAVALGARKVVLLGGGEPCVYPRLGELIGCLRSRFGLAVEMFTNGALIDAPLARFLYEQQVCVVVKRNSLVPAVQDELAGVPGACQAIERGLAALLAAGYPDARHGLGVQTIICRQNLGEIPELWRWARSRKVLPYFENVTLAGRAAEHDILSVPKAEIAATVQTICSIDRSEYGIEWLAHPPMLGTCCDRHLYSILIKANGDFCPCVGVDIALGNLRRDRLAEVVRGHPVVDNLRNIYERIGGRCRRCRFNGECYGCRGNAFHLAGDYLASDPRCWLNGDSGSAPQP
jgi:radical SAM protein with 4Fe4S-binding SPASM domain